MPWLQVELDGLPPKIVEINPLEALPLQLDKNKEEIADPEFYVGHPVVAVRAQSDNSTGSGGGGGGGGGGYSSSQRADDKPKTRDERWAEGRMKEPRIEDLPPTRRKVAHSALTALTAPTGLTNWSTIGLAYSHS